MRAMWRNTGGVVALALLMSLGACSPESGNDQADNTVSTVPGGSDNATATVQPLSPATSNDYPPCSATVKDHCVEK
jgi:hypothetical protein